MTRHSQTSNPDETQGRIKPGCLIIGAGLAGLYTAWRLEQQGISYQLLEARSRVGGRIDAATGPGDVAMSVDLGPSWFWPHQQRIKRLLGALGLSWFEQFAQGAALFEQVPGQSPVRHLGAGSPPSFRISGGTSALTDTLSRSLMPARLLLNHPVERAIPADDGWRVAVTTETGKVEFRASSLVLALPPRQAHALLGDAQLPETFMTDLSRQQTWMSAQAKFVATYARPFWREAGLAGEAFSRIGPLVEIHDASPEDGEFAALFGFLGVPAQQRLALEEPVLIDHCRQQLERLFGAPDGQPLFMALRDWAREPFTVSAADRDEPPAHARFPLDRYEKTLAKQGLWLAGSEFSVEEPGYLEGALAASERVLAGLGKAC